MRSLGTEIISLPSSPLTNSLRILAAHDARPAPWEAEISMVYVLKEHRGVGVGRTLMKTAADHCIRRAMFSGGLWVLRDNGPARDFYEALKGEHAGRKTDSVGGKVVPLVGYYWRDLAQLAERATPRVAIGEV